MRRLGQVMFTSEIALSKNPIARTGTPHFVWQPRYASSGHAMITFGNQWQSWHRRIFS